MVKKKWLNNIINVALSITALFSTLSHIVTLFEIEIRKTKKNLILLLVLLLIMNVLFAAIWFCFLALLFVYFTSSLHWTLPIVLFVILLINIVLFFIVYFMIKNTADNLTFKKTCELFFPKK